MSYVEDMGFDGYPVPFEIPHTNDMWITKDKEEIHISDMDNAHLYNAYLKFNDNRLAREMLLRLFRKAYK
jgi:hypothetical protein